MRLSIVLGDLFPLNLLLTKMLTTINFVNYKLSDNKSFFREAIEVTSNVCLIERADELHAKSCFWSLVKANELT